MCKITITNPLFCPCNNPQCPQQRKGEKGALIRWPQLPRGAHIVGGTAIKLTDDPPLFCDQFLAIPEAERIVTDGRGDLGMALLCLQFCPKLDATASGGSGCFTKNNLCDKCIGSCMLPADDANKAGPAVTEGRTSA